jgi:hypothetical protein
MQTQTTGLSAFLGLAATFGIALAPASADAQSTERARRIDGSSPARFEASVASLQNELRERRREDFDVALAIIWVSNTVDSDFDDDGDTDLDDMRLLEQDADDLLTNIRRGNVVSAIQDRAEAGDEYTAADHFKQLDGLGYDEVVSLAGRPSGESYQAAVRRFGAEGQCGQRGEQSVIRLKRCARSPNAPGGGIGLAAGRTLNEAIEALNEQKYAEARAAIGKLRLNSLSSYERSKVEEILSAISYGEGKLAEARQHLENARAAGGLTAQETTDVLARIGFIDARLAGKVL